MSKVTDLPLNNGSSQLPSVDTSKSKVSEPIVSPENGSSLHDSSSENSTLRFENRMAQSMLINNATQLRNNLSRQFDESNKKDKAKNEKDTQAADQKINLSLRQTRQLSLKLPASATCLQALKEGLMKHAAQMGLPIEGQEAFAEKHLKNFIAQATANGSKNLLQKAGDFTLLNSDASPFEAKIIGSDLHLTLGSTALPNLLESSAPTEASFHRNNHLPTENARFHGNSSFHNANLQRAEIEAKLSATLTASPEFNSLKAVIQKKIENILKELGLGGEAASAPGNARATSAENLPFALQNHQAALPEGSDKALFATVFGMALDASEESRTLHGDGVLQEFANYGGEQSAGGKESVQTALASFLQNGTQAGFSVLLESARADFSQTDLEGISQLQTKLGPSATSNLVVGVVTMSVMTREVVEQLNHVSQESSLGLSDNALAALQKAHSSLRDHLTTTDLIGAVGDLKNSPIDINGQQYNFLPEVSEALNSLREARNRILSETMYAKSDAGGIDSQQRFVRETEVLFNITERIENLLRTA